MERKPGTDTTEFRQVMSLRGWENSENDDGLGRKELVVLKAGDNSESCRGDEDGTKGGNEAKSRDSGMMWRFAICEVV